MTQNTLALQSLYDWEQKAPDQITLTQPLAGGVLQTFTWAQVADQARRMAAHLQRQALQDRWPTDTRIAILSKNCAWWLISDLAIWMAGYVSVPLYPTLTADTVRQILTHSGARAIFVGKLDGWEAMAPGVPAGLHAISFPVAPESVLAARDAFAGWDAICQSTGPLSGSPTRAADELCTLMYTSGTTGAPKGVMHSFGNFAFAIGSGAERMAMRDGERMLSYLPLAHVAERVLVEHGWLRYGMQIWFAETQETFGADMQRARPTVFFSVPRLWVKFQQGVHQKMPPAKLKLLLKLPLIGRLVRRKVLCALGLDQCRIAAGGAAPMPVALLEWFARLGLPINEAYGMTENAGVSHITAPGQNQRGTVGPPYPGVDARIDPESGELQMRSPGLMLGYYDAPELTRETFTADGWLKSGDKGAIDSQGLLRITGRVKDLFKTSKGKYVAPAPIEDKLGVHPAIEACCVSGANLSQPLALVMLGAGAAAYGDRLETDLALHLAAVNARLDHHEQLSCLVLVREVWGVDNGFVTPTFKVKRNRIEEVYAPRFEGWVAQGKAVVRAD